MLPSSGPEAGGGNVTAGAGSLEGGAGEGGLGGVVVSLLVTLAVILGVLVVANLYTIAQVLNALLFSQRTHLQRAVAKHDVINSEGNTRILCFRYSLYIISYYHIDCLIFKYLL